MTSRAEVCDAVEPADETPPAAPNTSGPMKPATAVPTAPVVARELPRIDSVSLASITSAMSRSCVRSATRSSESMRSARRAATSDRSQSSVDTSFCCPGASGSE